MTLTYVKIMPKIHLNINFCEEGFPITNNNAGTDTKVSFRRGETFQVDTTSKIFLYAKSLRVNLVINLVDTTQNKKRERE